MSIIILLIVAVVILIIVDNVRCNRQLDAFFERAQDFTDMYQSILDLIDDDDKDVEIIEYPGIFYNVEVEKGDYRKFLLETKAIAEDVIQYYNQIDSRYFEEMDDETAEYLEITYERLMNVYKQVRVDIWQKGFLN